jgi:hypothetical protein
VRDADSWWPIETAPKDGSWIMVGWFFEESGTGPREVCYWDKDAKDWRSQQPLGPLGAFQSTHWHPIDREGALQ